VELPLLPPVADSLTSDEPQVEYEDKKEELEQEDEDEGDPLQKR